jgi:hypothetical protein
MGAGRLAISLLFLLGLTNICLAQADFQIDRQTVEAWIFQGQNTAVSSREAMEAQIQLKIDSIRNSIDLSDDQVAQLTLAGQGDIKRFFDQITLLCDQIARMDTNRQTAQEAYALVAPLQQKLVAGLFDEDSLMHKVLRGSLSKAQLEELDHSMRRRREQMIVTVVRAYLTSIDAMIPMTGDQLEKLTDILVQRVAKDQLSGEYGRHVVGYRLFEVSDAELKTILQEPQLEAMKRLRGQMAATLQFLEQQDLIHHPEDDAAGDRENVRAQ